MSAARIFLVKRLSNAYLVRYGWPSDFVTLGSVSRSNTHRPLWTAVRWNDDGTDTELGVFDTRGAAVSRIASPARMAEFGTKRSTT